MYFLGPSDGPNAWNFHGEATNFRGAMSNFRGAMSNFRGEATNFRGEAPGDRGEATNFHGEATNFNTHFGDASPKSGFRKRLRVFFSLFFTNQPKNCLSLHCKIRMSNE